MLITKQKLLSKHVCIMKLTRKRSTELVYVVLVTCHRNAIASCYAGTYKSPVSLGCLGCNPGYYAPDYNTWTACKSCPVNTYSRFAARSCTKCPMGTYTEGTGTRSILSCHCNIGRYWANSDHSQPGACAKCGPGSINASKTNAMICVNCGVGYIANSARTACVVSA